MRTIKDGPNVRFGFNITISPAFLVLVAGVIVYRQSTKRFR